MSSNIGTLFIIKSGQLLFKRNVIFKREIRSNKSNTKNLASVLKDKSLQVQYIVRVAMKNNYLWRWPGVHINQERQKAWERLILPGSLKTSNAINKLCCIVWKQVPHLQWLPPQRFECNKIWKVSKRRGTTGEDNKHDRRTPEKEEGYTITVNLKSCCLDAWHIRHIT